MVNRRGAIALGSAGALIFSATLLAQQTEKQREELLKKETETVIKFVDGLAASASVPNDLSLTWVRDDLLKAEGNKQYVPYNVVIDPSKVTGGNVAIYCRVASKAATTPEPPAPAGKKDDKKDKNKKNPEWQYEEISLVEVPSGQSGPMRISRSFTVASGSYDVFVVVKEPTPKQKNAPAPKISVIKQAMNVPDLWNDELNTSSVIVFQRIDNLPAPLTPQEMVSRPYSFGAMEIIPALDTKFTKKSELSTFMLIYNAKTDSANKPDVSIEYSFYAKEAGGEKFYNKTNPQNLNAGTLPPQFDFAAGHELQSAQAVPLASFPEGEYRLEIKVTDKLSNKSLTRDVNFTVSGS